MLATPAKMEATYSAVTNVLQVSISSASKYSLLNSTRKLTRNLISSDPPLSEDDIPVGSWLCNSCRFKSKDEVEEIPVTSTTTMSSRRTKKRSGSTESTIVPKKTLSSPFDELIKAAVSMNPKQFKLPKELELHHQFPGFDKGLYPSPISPLSYQRVFFLQLCQQGAQREDLRSASSTKWIRMEWFRFRLKLVFIVRNHVNGLLWWHAIIAHFFSIM